MFSELEGCKLQSGLIIIEFGKQVTLGTYF